MPAHASVSSAQAANLPSQGVEAQTQVHVPQTESIPQNSQVAQPPLSRCKKWGVGKPPFWCPEWGPVPTPQVQAHATQVPAVSSAGASADACIVQSPGQVRATQVPMFSSAGASANACIAQSQVQVHAASGASSDRAGMQVHSKEGPSAILTSPASSADAATQANLHDAQTSTPKPLGFI